MMIMIRDNNFKKFPDPVNSPLMKLRISADELRIVFTPKTYVHLVNIGQCFKSPEI